MFRLSIMFWFGFFLYRLDEQSLGCVDNCAFELWLYAIPYKYINNIKQNTPILVKFYFIENIDDWDKCKNLSKYTIR